MALAPSVVKLLSDLEAALSAVIASDAVAAIEAEVNTLLPSSAQPVALSLEAATLAAAQAAVAALLAKIPAP
jgi:hypothetical protein